MGVPLHIDDDLEKRLSIRPKASGLRKLITKAVEYLRKNYRCFDIWCNYYSLPYGRRCLYAQLSQRTAFPAAEWGQHGYTELDLRELLKIIQEVMNWPNYNFLPNDRLELLMIPDVEDFPWLIVFCGIRDKLGLKLDFDEEVPRISREDWQLIRLVEYVFARRPVSKRQ